MPWFYGIPASLSIWGVNGDAGTNLTGHRPGPPGLPAAGGCGV